MEGYEYPKQVHIGKANQFKVGQMVIRSTEFDDYIFSTTGLCKSVGHVVGYALNPQGEVLIEVKWAGDWRLGEKGAIYNSHHPSVLSAVN